jgi:hypothetical protein
MQSCQQQEPNCERIYRYCEGGKIRLFLVPDPCLLKDTTKKNLFAKLYNTILVNNLETELQKLQIVDSEGQYDSFVALITKLFGVTIGTESPRILVTESDGTVIMDSSKTTNTYANWKAKKINENHNTRIAVLNSQLQEGGVGSETKYSSSTGTKQVYVAVRAGAFLEAAGSFRLSVNA